MMDVFSPQQQELIKSLQSSGEYASESEVLDDALELLRQRNELRHRLSVATSELERGEGIPGADAVSTLRDELNRAS